ncbi:hypothetical protein Anas_08290 [Armadillidium nasatum]|uniref:Uncharacterized protein n=1 Tax=Armadillidium nasatum TaxID=96803 RepID=A0A5N5SM57_9CRUS|nr:hypothetical protein Anas_08290 [Armadillidium nasatum]
MIKNNDFFAYFASFIGPLGCDEDRSRSCPCPCPCPCPCSCPNNIVCGLLEHAITAISGGEKVYVNSSPGKAVQVEKSSVSDVPVIS